MIALIILIVIITALHCKIFGRLFTRKNNSSSSRTSSAFSGLWIRQWRSSRSSSKSAAEVSFNQSSYQLFKEQEIKQICYKITFTKENWKNMKIKENRNIWMLKKRISKKY